ncbi:MAG: hypothetical protein GY851_02410 [bacterium]|nr:hypothetical protein [bacterium]
MDLESALRHIGEPDTLESVTLHWDESIATLPEGTPSFLDSAEFLESLAYGGIAPEAGEPLQEAARQILADPVLKAFAWHGYRRLYDWADGDGFHHWPSFKMALSELAGCFYLLLGLGMVPKVRSVHASMGVEERITRDTCNQLWSMSENCRGASGGLGLERMQLFWLRNYTDGRLFRLGRMEWRIKSVDIQCRVFRHRTKGLVLALAEDGIRYNGDGHVDGAFEVHDEENAWTSSLRVTDSEAVGHPVSPRGHALRDTVTLSMQEWECVFQSGDSTLDMHIPAGGNMGPDNCRESFAAAVAFFAKHFPDQPCRTFYCSSWIYGPPLEGILPAEANLVRHMREVYLFPLPSRGNGGLWFVFLKEDVDPAKLPRDNSLRRAMAEFLDQGGVWRAGGMFMLTDDLKRYGAQHYRNRWSEVRELVGI